MDAEEIQEELEHQEFMLTVRRLQAAIFGEILSTDKTDDVTWVVDQLDDIAYFGTEPVFADMVFDALLKEEGA